MKIFPLAALVVSATSSIVKAPRVAPPLAPRRVRAVPVAPNIIVRRPLLASLRVYKKRRTLELPFYSDAIYGFAFSPDGKTLAGIGSGIGLTTPAGKHWLSKYNCAVFLFDVKTGLLKKRLLILTNGYISVLRRVIWSPDGKFVAALHTESDSIPSPIAVWNARSGQLTAQIQEAKWDVTAAGWTADGTLFVAHASKGAPFAASQMLLCSSDGATIRKTISLGNRTVIDMNTRFGGPPRLLVWSKVGQNVAEHEPIVQSSICHWENDALSAPLVQLPAGDLALGAGFSQHFATLWNFHQFSQANGWFLTLVDLKAKRIVWEKWVKPATITPAIQFSKDGQRIWVGGSFRGNVVMNTKTGAFSGVNSNDFPTFSKDEKYFVRPLEQFTGWGNAVARGTKPHLAIAELWEK